MVELVALFDRIVISIRYYSNQMRPRIFNYMSRVAEFLDTYPILSYPIKMSLLLLSMHDFNMGK